MVYAPVFLLLYPVAMEDQESRREKVAGVLAGDGDSRETGEELVRAAVASRVSDVHLDEIGERVRVRWRRDGLMEEVVVLPEDRGKSLARFFKVAAGLPPVTAEIPGEGFVEMNVSENEPVSIRVSSIRGTSGTKTSLRVLRSIDSSGELTELGLDVETGEWLKEWAEFGSGMVLVSGPTGSGKTTTIYSLLQSLESRPLNLVSIEDPVEKSIDHVTQVDLSLEHDLDIVGGMRALLRHDPDLIFVGELRDAAIARSAMQAAFSGHVIVATMHSHDPAGAITRLRGFGLPDHEIAASLRGVLGQQLVRKTTDSEPWLSAGEKKWLDGQGLKGLEELEVAGEGEEHRYEGRTAVFEWWKIRESDYYSILEGADERTLRSDLRGSGLKSLMESGVDLVRNGTSTVEEIRRLA